MSNRPKITNTSKQDSLIDLVAGYERAGDPSQGILDQEARGQREVVEAGGSRLPAQGTVHDDDGTWHCDIPMGELWKSYGVVVGERVKDDEIWVKATLPPGWKIERTDHSMWTSLVDDKGRSRASIFYKAASYDREAFIQAKRRFGAHSELEEADDIPYDERSHFGFVTDGGKKIQTFGPFANDEGERPAYGTEQTKTWKSSYQKSMLAAEAWVTENYPDWKTLTAYWD